MALEMNNTFVFAYFKGLRTGTLVWYLRWLCLLRVESRARATDNRVYHLLFCSGGASRKEAKNFSLGFDEALIITRRVLCTQKVAKKKKNWPIEDLMITKKEGKKLLALGFEPRISSLLVMRFTN